MWAKRDYTHTQNYGQSKLRYVTLLTKQENVLTYLVKNINLDHPNILLKGHTVLWRYV